MTAPLIAIVGSYDPARETELKLKNLPLAAAAGVELGRELARHGCHIAVYASYPYLLEVDAVKGYVEEKKAKLVEEQKTNPEAELEKDCIQVHFSLQYARPSFAEDDGGDMFNFMPDNNPQWEVSFYRSLREVDGVIMLGGGPSSMIAGVVALGFGKPIVTVASFGGYAEKMWGVLPEQQKVQTSQEFHLMADPWRPQSAKRYIEMLVRMREQIVREEQEKREQVQRREESLQAQITQNREQFNKQLAVLQEQSQQEIETRIKAALDNRANYDKTVQRYAMVSAFFLLVALALWVIPADGLKNVRLLMILLLAAPLAAGISGSTLQVVFAALGIGQSKLAETQALHSVVTHALAGLVGGGSTAGLYILTQLIAIGDVQNLDAYYRRLIPFALFTGFAAGFALDVVARKFRDAARKSVGSPFPPQPPAAGGIEEAQP